MARTITPTYTVTINKTLTMAWPTRNAGRPSDKNLKGYVETLENSTKPGGCNSHLGNFVVTSATVQYNGTTVTLAEYIK